MTHRVLKSTSKKDTVKLERVPDPQFAAGKIQALQRGKKTREDLVKQHEASKTIQKLHRGKSQRDKLKRQHAASVKIEGFPATEEGYAKSWVDYASEDFQLENHRVLMPK